MDRIVDYSRTQLRRRVQDTLSIAWLNSQHFEKTEKPAKIAFMISRENAKYQDSMKILCAVLQNVAFHFNYCQIHNFLISIKFASQEDSPDEYVSIILCIFPDARGESRLGECLLWMMGYIDSLFKVLKGSTLLHLKTFEPYKSDGFLANLGFKVCLKGVHDHD